MTLDRRRFLLTAGLGVAAATASLPAIAAAHPKAEPDWAALRSKLSGQLFLPADSGYNDAKLGFFTMYDRHRPAAVARCTRQEDVQACVATAVANDFPLAARSGGHSYAGYSTPDRGLVIDISRMNTVEVRPDGTVVVGAGARLFDIYSAVAKAGRLLPGGTCPSVGIAGLTLGGGLSAIGRKYGLTCDRLVNARIITPDGTIREASATPDLFWALRGGGGGNFGVVTSFTFQTAPSHNFTTFNLSFPAQASAAVVHTWQTWCQEVPDELWSQIGVSGNTQLAGTFAGPPNQLQGFLDTFIRRVGSQPTGRDVRERSYFDTMVSFAGCEPSNGGCTPSWNGGGGRLDRGTYVATSRILTKPAADPQAFVNLLNSVPGMYTLLDSFGGAIARGGDAAFPHRKGIASIQLIKGVNNGDEAAARAAMRPVRDELGRMFGESAYVNYIDPQMPNWANAYYGANLARLRSIAAKYDPGKVFRYGQSLHV
ncbi:FAD-binding protein [Kibdelosporangium philippinense]|uniref:FAD-binding protein n=1 Tax=Kibdelosporangium philippinense TaxID=211113 RepID=A0ABS8ZWW0_9PSEU|nr:FAD-binding protein [Kibdelosporangium philippinense]MCE7011096.1 FAD-binding protein [Kibdelosporangium philippinense]